MKRIFSVFIISVLLICVLGMTSCEFILAQKTPGEGEHVHMFTQVTVAPTCSNEGYIEYTCECGYVMQDTFVAPNKNNHKYQLVETVEATCTVDGYEKSVCSYCDDEKVEVLEASHKLGSWQVATAPTCTTVGEERSYCSECTYYESRELAPAHVIDEYLDVVVEPTCTTDGYTTHYCELCDYSYTDSVKRAFGHDWIPDLDAINGDEWITVRQGDCTNYGEEMRKCAVCDFIERRYTEYVHVYEEFVTEPTCTTQGYTTHACVNCDDAYLTDFVDPCHTFGNWETYVAPSCKQSGLERRYCELCDYFEERKVDPQHTYDTVKVVEPTKLTSGYTEHICDCGLSYRDNFVSAYGSEGLQYELHNVWNSETARYDVYYVVVGIGSCRDNEIAIPFEYKGIAVKEIGYAAFKDDDYITKVYLTENITKIGISAFWNCDNLTAFYYDGTKAEWEELDKGESWDMGLHTHEVECSDGVIKYRVEEEKEEEPEEK